MNEPLQFDFIVDKESKSIRVNKVFASTLESVWEAWTKPEILDRWWAPKPYKTITKSMDFKVGGNWLYKMVSPEGEAHWCLAEYKEQTPLKSFSALDAFCNDHGVINSEFPRSLWINSFHSKKDHTLVEITIKYEKVEDLEKIIELGFKEGFSMAIGNLDEYFASKK